MPENENENQNQINITNKGYGRALFGRKVIYTDESEITASNVVAVIQNAFMAHLINRNDISYLYDYYKGKQPILDRIKEIRPEICNKVVVNLAYDIVDFKVSYLLGSPFSYVSDKEKIDSVNILNDYMRQVNKEAQDREIIEWNHICGTAYRYIQALDPKGIGNGDVPYEMVTLDPRNTFIIYSSTYKKTRLASVTYTVSETNGQITHFVVYTKENIFSYDIEKKEEREVTKAFRKDNNPLGEIPIYEYPANNARLGAFEVVLPLLDAYNRISSNDVDGIEQAIQSFLKFINCDLDSNALENLKQYGAINIKSIDGAAADVDSVKTDYSYDGANVTKNDIYRNIMLICGMPITGNGKSLSANNGAILLSNGWSQAEAKARASEVMFKGSERLMLNLVLKICKENGKNEIKLRSTDIDCKSPRTNYENMQVKAQVLCEMLNSPRVHPKLAFESCGLFSDPENAYLISDEHYKEMLETWAIKSTPDDDGVNGDGGEEKNKV